MKRRVIFAAVGLALFFGRDAGAGLIQVGSAYTVTGTDFPTDFSQSVTLDQTTKAINSGQLYLTETITPDGSNAEWVEFNFLRGPNAPSRGLAGNLNSFWSVEISNLLFNQPVNFDQGFIDWTRDGAAFPSITSIGPANYGFAVEPNPINPGRGSVFSLPSVILPTRADAFTPLDVSVAFSTYMNELSNHGVDPAGADGFDYALHFTGTNFPIGFRHSDLSSTVQDLHGYVVAEAGNELQPTATPEPGSWTLALCGLIAMGVFVACRRGRHVPA